MISTWNNKLGSRERRPVAVLVTSDGKPHLFKGLSIVGVCAAAETASEKNGKWSNSTFQIKHAEDTAFVHWRENFENGRVWPQLSWEESFLWLAEKAPLLDREQFESFIRAEFTRVAERFDAACKADEEFGKPMDAGIAARIECAKQELQAVRAEFEAIQAQRRELQQALADIERVKGLNAAEERLRKTAEAALAQARQTAETDANQAPVEAVVGHEPDSHTEVLSPPQGNVFGGAFSALSKL